MRWVLQQQIQYLILTAKLLIVPVAMQKLYHIHTLILWILIRNKKKKKKKKKKTRKPLLP